MKSTLSAEQAEAIGRFCRDNDAIPMLSVFPLQVNFRIKATDEKVTKTLAELVYTHQVAKLDEQKARANEKKRIERENKWKPTAKY